LRTAIEIARRQTARMVESSAATSLARLLKHQGRGEEARTMLAEIYNWFTEGFDTPTSRTRRSCLTNLKTELRAGFEYIRGMSVSFINHPLRVL
jgi:hypothetical protein